MHPENTTEPVAPNLMAGAWLCRPAAPSLMAAGIGDRQRAAAAGERRGS